MTIAALFVDERPGGAYVDLPGVDVWGVSRDARRYAGPWPVVAHPPCERWGRYWHGGPSARIRRTKGDDGGCFAAALAAVDRFGGVIEHPEASAAWDFFGLRRPPRFGGWVSAGWGRGWTCCVEQGHYGHRARKATWLYVSRVRELPVLRWGRSRARVRLDAGYHSAEERRAASDRSARDTERLAMRERAATPPEFRDVLLSIARSARSEAA